MADGLCSGGLVGNVNKTPIMKDYDDLVTAVIDDDDSEKVNSFYLATHKHKLFDKLCSGDSSSDGKPTDKSYEFLQCEDDCRKKRCVDRYDSSESSDSGVAILSCTDCSTASSDITDPGSPFSSASSHSEDSALHPVPKMPPAQNVHHPPWTWTTEERTVLIPKRVKSKEEPSAKQSPPCLHNTPKKMSKSKHFSPKQGKITEYFKSQVKSNRKEAKSQKAQITVPRKILPAPSKHPETLTHHHFAPTVALTAVAFPSNLTYIHSKTPKPQENIFVPQFITNDKIAAIPCINVIHQPLQKITATTINNFNCVKLNTTTVVPIVKLNTLPTFVGKTRASLQHPLAKKVVGECAEAATPKQDSVLPDEPPKDEDHVRRKENFLGDSDSGISFKSCLEIVTDEGDAVVTASQKSPILSQPKTIRFPPNKRKANGDLKDVKSARSRDSGSCHWESCSAQFDTSGALLEHLQVKHVISQASQEHYVCLWIGCKVHGRTSCSRSWLERHVLAHAGTKPFRCIVDGCGHRFNSQLTLERHVNGHFTGEGPISNNVKKTPDNANSKLYRRNGKRIRFRRQPWSARMFDFIDPGVMEGLQHKLLTMTQSRTHGQEANTGNNVTVLSQVVARRVEPDGNVKFLVRWHPSNILPEEWVTEKEYVAEKSVPTLQPPAKDAVQLRLFFSKRKAEKQRRKPSPKQT